MILIIQHQINITQFLITSNIGVIFICIIRLDATWLNVFVFSETKIDETLKMYQ